MKLLSIWISCLLLVSTFAFARPWTFNDDVITGIPVEGAVKIDAQNLGIGHLKIRISDPVVKMEQLDLNKRTWTLTTIDGETRLWQDGKPSLPLISRVVRLPNTGNVSLSVSLGEFDEYTNIDILPQQPTDLKKVGNHLEPSDYTFNDEIYNKDEWFPTNIATMTSPEIIRDARVALLGVQPVIYNPVTRIIRVYKTIDVEISPIGGTGTNEILDTRSHAVQSFAGIYSDIIGADDLFDDARRAPPGQILFIARAGVDTILRPFADWKTQSGHPTQIYTTTATTPAPIQSYIQNAYNTWNPPLEAIILVAGGGASNTPYQLPSYPATYQYSDHDYSVIGNSLNGSMWQGRILCDNATELQLQINRSMNYERTPNMGANGADTAWFTHGWGYASVTSTWHITTNPPCIRFCNEMMRDRGITNTDYDEHNGNVVDATINQRLSGGAIFWAHRASWEFEIAQSDVQGIQNINKPFVGFNISCATGSWYPPDTYSMHVAVTKLGTPAQPRGALASVSTTGTGTNPSHNNVMAAGSFFGFGVRNGRTPGPMYYEGKYQMWRNYRIGDSVNAAGFVHWNNPMGDISANIWTGVPRRVTTNSPTSIGIGQNRLDVQVMQGTNPVVGAMVTAWKKSAGGTNETYNRVVTDDSGRVTLTLSNTSAGNMFVTVASNQVGQNIYPHIDTIQVAASPIDLAVTNINILDASVGGRLGNGDGIANPGEIVDMSVQLTNRGTNVANAINGTLTSSDPRVVVLNSTANWGTDSAGHSVGSVTPFRVVLQNTIRDLELFPLRLSLSYTQGSRVVSVPITVRSIRMIFVGDTLTPAVITPGSGADIKVAAINNGGIATTTGNITLFSLSPMINVTTSDVSLTGIPTGVNINTPVTRPFHIITDSRIVPGTVFNMGCAYTSGSLSDTIYFMITVGIRISSLPSGPDPYGYVAYDNTDTSYFAHPTYSWVDIIPGINGGTGTRLPLNDPASSTTSDVSAVVRLPFTATYYGIAYDSVTICSNGWLAFGAQPYYQNARNWHLPAHEGPRNIVAVNWCDQSNTGTNEGAYIKNDTANHRYIVTWKTTTVNTPTGQEYQLIIYNPLFNQTPTGDAPLKFQYKSFTPTAYSGGETGVSYCTVGISDSTFTRAIEYCYWNIYTPGSAPIPTGTPATGQRAILFTTTSQTNLQTGTLTGSVRRAATNAPITGASVLILNGGMSATTDSSGHYTLTLPVGSYSVHATSFNFNNHVDTVTIVQNQTSTLNFLLGTPDIRVTLHPQDTMMVPGDSIWASLLDTGQTASRQIYIHNTGDAPLAWNSTLLYSGSFDELDTLWNPITSMNVSQTVGDNQISGVEFDGTNFWVSGANNYSYPHHVYKLDHDGHLVATYNCPDLTGLYGWRDLAWDGHFLYGSYANYIDQIAVDSFHVVQRFPINVNPARAIAVDTAGGVIYYCDQASVIYKIHLSNGSAIGTLPNPSGGGVYGLKWYPNDPDGRKLYAFARDSSGHSAGARIYRVDPVTGTAVASARLGASNENAGGFCVTPRWNPLLWTAAAILQSSSGCRLGIYELSFNSTWIAYGPHYDTLQAGQRDSVTVNLNSAFMPPFRYRVAIQFNTNATTQTVIVPVVMIVTPLSDVITHSISLPSSFALEQNYPNPFNPTTSISFTLPLVAPVKLTIHDELGREVAKLVSNETMNPGRHTITFDGSRLASGVYFYRMEAGTFVSTKKMLMLK